MSSNVLIFCSWLDPKSSVGVFFREQAAILKPEFEPILIVFIEKQFLFKDILGRNRLYVISETKSIEGISILQVFYPSNKYIPRLINKLLREKTLKILNNFLEKKKKVNVSFIHAQSTFYAAFWAYKYYKYFKVPFMITEHNQISLRGVSSKKILLMNLILKESKMNLVVSYDKIRQFVTNGFFYKFINVGNLVSNEFYYKKTVKRKDSLNMITIGAYDPIKDHKTLFEALKFTDKKISGKKITFTWVGCNAWGQDNQNSVSHFLNNYNFKNIKIVIEPLLERSKIAKKLNNSDLFVFSSISEGMPVSVLEALACGIPVFTSNCGGVDEVIHFDNGRIYPVTDAYKLHILLMDFIESKCEFNPKNISDDIISKYGTSAFRKRMLGLYKNVSND
jgi:glycosyltransferase involved in cell wall biosynthesis